MELISKLLDGCILPHPAQAKLTGKFKLDKAFHQYAYPISVEFNPPLLRGKLLFVLDYTFIID